jgi:probable F420-dependent oxidoreductase
VKVRFGISLGANTPPDQLGPIVDHLESSGVDSLWFSELVYSPAVDPMVGMAYAVARTKRLKVGTSVAVLPGRHPVLVAKQLASLAALAPKRVLPVFGLRSAIPAEREVFTVPDGERGAVFDESLQILRAALVEESASYDGRYFSVTAAAVAPRPDPPLDIWLGGSAPAAFRRIGTLADGWLGSFLTPDEARAGREAIERAAEEAGRSIAGCRRRRAAARVGRGGAPSPPGRRSRRSGRRRLGSAAPPSRPLRGCRSDEIRYQASR